MHLRQVRDANLFLPRPISRAGQNRTVYPETLAVRGVLSTALPAPFGAEAPPVLAVPLTVTVPLTAPVLFALGGSE